MEQFEQPQPERTLFSGKEVFLDKLKKLVALGKSKQNALDATEINDFLPEITSDRSRWMKFIIT